MTIESPKKENKSYFIEAAEDYIKSLEKEQSDNIGQLPKIKGWVARYANGDLEVGREKPRYYEDEGKTYITDPGPTIPLDKSWFPELHWLDEPIEVELTLKRI